MSVPNDAGGAPLPRSYLDLARTGRGAGRFYLLGLLANLLIGSLLAGLVYARALAIAPAWVPAMAPLLLSFIPELLVSLAVVVVINQRGWRTVITPRPRIAGSQILYGAVLWAVAMVVTTIPACLIDSDGLRFGPASWTGFAMSAVVALLLIPLQAASEEVMYRGYLIQWVSLATRRRWLLSLVSGVLFTLPHMTNPELAGLHGPALLLGPWPYFSVGFTFAWVSLALGSIEVAIGAHVINNILLATLVGASGSALEATTLITDTSPNYLLSVASSFATCVIFGWLLSRRRYACGGEPDLPDPSGIGVPPLRREGDPQGSLGGRTGHGDLLVDGVR